MFSYGEYHMMIEIWLEYWVLLLPVCVGTRWCSATVRFGASEAVDV